MIKLKVLLISNSNKSAFCEAIEVSYKNQKAVARGNIGISKVLELNSIHSTNFLSCITKVNVVNGKEYYWLVLQNILDDTSAIITYLVFEKKYLLLMIS